ncbi:hypothetical protein CsSME_00034927 [Camellia sinensis var. sinensis]
METETTRSIGVTSATGLSGLHLKTHLISPALAVSDSFYMKLTEPDLWMLLMISPNSIPPRRPVYWKHSLSCLIL